MIRHLLRRHDERLLRQVSVELRQFAKARPVGPQRAAMHRKAANRAAQYVDQQAARIRKGLR